MENTETRAAKYAVQSAALIFAPGGCTEGPVFAEAAAAQSAIPAGFGRIAVYRSQKIQGFGVKPAVLIDGLPTGKYEVDSVFFVNVRPGPHVVSASTTETSVVRVDVKPGQTAYMLCTIEVGPLVGVPKLVETTKPALDAFVFKGQF